MANKNLFHYRIESPYVNSVHDGIRVLHLTDLHIKPRSKLDYIHQIIDSYSPEFVALTGDYVCYDTKSLWLVTKILDEIKLPKFATLGNHDHWTAPKEVAEALRNAGCIVLQNQVFSFFRNQAAVNIIGIDDKVTGNDKSKNTCDQANNLGTNIVLSHVGDVVNDLEGYQNTIILSGHTHGGQIIVPWVTKKMLHAYGLQYHYGFYQKNDQLVYVSRGVGESIPVRWRAKHEICIFDLFNAQKLSYNLIKHDWS